MSGSAYFCEICKGIAEHETSHHPWPSRKEERVDFVITKHMVNLFLIQVRNDRKVPYWSEGRHKDTLDHVQAWLESLRDTLDATDEPIRNAALMAAWRGENSRAMFKYEPCALEHEPGRVCIRPVGHDVSSPPTAPEVVDEPWDEITAKHWKEIKGGLITIKEAYEKG